MTDGTQKYSPDKKKRIFKYMLIGFGLLCFVLAAAVPKMLRTYCPVGIGGRCSADISAIRSASLMYRMDKNRFPEQLSDLTPNYLDFIPKSERGTPIDFVSDTSHFVVVCQTKKNCRLKFDSFDTEIKTEGNECP